MSAIPGKVEERLKREIPAFQSVLRSAVDRDVNEADTVVIVMDILDRVFGMDKYTEITREFAIKGTFVDLAVRVDGKLEYFVEVKAVGLNLKGNHLRQAIDYAAKEGVRWVVLTNGIAWEVHRILVDGQVSNEQVLKFNFLELSPRKREDLELLFMLCRKGVSKALMDEYYDRQQACNRFIVGALLTSEPIVNAVRRQLRHMTPGLKVTDDELRALVENEVIKREVLSSEQGLEARNRLKRFSARQGRPKRQVPPSLVVGVRAET